MYHIKSMAKLLLQLPMQQAGDPGIILRGWSCCQWPMSLVFTAFATAIVSASVIMTAVVAAANAAAAALHQWLVVMLPALLSAARSVIHHFCHRAIVNTFAAGRSPLSPTFTSRCSIALVPAIHHLCHSRWWLVVTFLARPAAYQLNHQTENVFMFPHLDIFWLTYSKYAPFLLVGASLTSTSWNVPKWLK